MVQTEPVFGGKWTLSDHCPLLRLVQAQASTEFRNCHQRVQTWTARENYIGGIPWKIAFIIYNKPWWKYTKCWLTFIATDNVCPWDWYQVEKVGEKSLNTKPWDWNCKGETKIKAVFTIKNAIWIMPENRSVSFKLIRKFYLCAGSEKSYYLKDILCFAVIFSFK